MRIKRGSLAAFLTTLLALALLPVLPAGNPGLAQAAPGDIGVRFAWGLNGWGALGNNSLTTTDVPVEGDWGGVPVADRIFTDVDMSDPNSDPLGCALAGGNAYCWGTNRVGQLGANTSDDSSLVPRAVFTGGVLAGKSLIGITVGMSHACALDTGGRAYCWGLNNAGQLGDGGAAGLTSNRPVAVDTSGVLQGKQLVQISSGAGHTCARDTAGALYCWGDNTYGQLGDGTKVTRTSPVTVNMAPMAGAAKFVAAGGAHTCAISTPGAAYCWGANGTGQIGDGTYGPANARTEPTAVDATGALSGRVLRGIALAERNTCAWDTRAFCWGTNGNGQLGIGSQPLWESFTPIAVSTSGALSGKDIDQVSVGSWSVCALDTDGAAYCWGAPWQGRLGIGPVNVDQLAPVAVSGTNRFAIIAVGDGYVSAITGPLSYTVTYDANQATSGSPPLQGSGPINGTYTVAANSGSLARSGYTFAGWNTNDQGTGTTYAAGTGTLTLTANTTLYAKWQPLPPPPPPPPSPPGPPVLREATPGARQVTLTWSRPDNEGTSPVTQYRVYAAPGGLVCTAQPTSAATTSCTATGLSHLTTYEFWVTAVSVIGESGPSNRLAASPLGPPGPPTAVAAVVADDSLSITWEPPASDGGTALTRYSVWIRVPGGEWKEIVSLPATNPRSYLVRDLVNGAAYEFRVTARNSSGEGPPSQVVTGSVTLPPMTVDTPDRVPPQTFMVFGALPHDAELVATFDSRNACTAGKSPASVPNVIAFLVPGTCTLEVRRGSASVIPTKIGTVQVSIGLGADLAPGVMEMDVIRVTYPEDAGGWALPKDQDAALDAWIDGWRFGWGGAGRPRESYGGPFVYCPSISFGPGDSLLNVATTPPGPARLASSRCSTALGTPVSLMNRTYRYVRDFRSNPRIFEVAMLPVHLPPLPPRDIKVKADAFEATITWDAPPTTERRPVTGFIAYIRPKGESKWTRVPVDFAKRTAKVSFEERAWKEVPIGTDIDVRIASTNEAGRGWASTDFRLDYRLPEFTSVPDVVPPQSWVPLLQRRGNPDMQMLTRGQGCSITRARYLLFTGPGGCEVIYRIDDHLGNYVRWATAYKVKVEEGAERSGRVRELDMVNITFVDGQPQADARSREILKELVGPDVEAVHMYDMKPGKVSVALVNQRQSYVRTTLQAGGERRSYVSSSPITTSGLPDGDGNLMRIAYIRKGRVD